MVANHGHRLEGRILARCLNRLAGGFPGLVADILALLAQVVEARRDFVGLVAEALHIQFFFHQHAAGVDVVEALLHLVHFLQVLDLDVRLALLHGDLLLHRLRIHGLKLPRPGIPRKARTLLFEPVNLRGLLVILLRGFRVVLQTLFE